MAFGQVRLYVNEFPVFTNPGQREIGKKRAEFKFPDGSKEG